MKAQRSPRTHSHYAEGETEKEGTCPEMGQQAAAKPALPRAAKITSPSATHCAHYFADPFHSPEGDTCHGPHFREEDTEAQRSQLGSHGAGV